MRVNVYAEELTERVELITKQIEGREYTAVRFYLELPTTVDLCPYEAGAFRPSPVAPIYCAGCGYANDLHVPTNIQGPFIHRPGDDDSGAVTFWGKQDLRGLLRKALALLDEHYDKREVKG